MEELKTRLQKLISEFPSENSAYELVLHRNLWEYKSILIEVNNFNDDLKHNTDHYFSDILRIESEIDQVQKGSSQKIRSNALLNATRLLKFNMQALSDLIVLK